MDSQKQHLVHPFHCLLTKLFFVNNTPFLRYQRKILISRGILEFQDQQLTSVPDLNTKSFYSFLTEKFLLVVHLKESRCSLRLTNMTLVTMQTQLSQFTPSNALLKESLSGVVLSTWATVIFFLLIKL
jgi:hypothetical protein